jgi:hypothetical protein
LAAQRFQFGGQQAPFFRESPHSVFQRVTLALSRGRSLVDFGPGLSARVERRRAFL